MTQPGRPRASGRLRPAAVAALVVLAAGGAALAYMLPGGQEDVTRTDVTRTDGTQTDGPRTAASDDSAAPGTASQDSAAPAAAEKAAPASAPAPSQAAAPAPPPDGLPTLFEQPDANRKLQAAAAAFRDGDRLGAELLLRGLASEHPGMADVHFAVAQLMALRGDVPGALASLRKAAAEGLRGPERLDDAIFAPLKDDPVFAAIRIAFAGDPPPAPPQPAPPVASPLTGGALVLDAFNCEWSESEGAVRAHVLLPPPPDGPEVVMSGRSEAALRLNRLAAAGRAAGNHGDFYENRDDDHSPLDLDLFPGITAVEHGEAAQAGRFSRGAAEGLAISVTGEAGATEAPPLIGNSSTAVTAGPAWRSMARLSLTEPERPQELWREYASNQVYVYPEHKDHDPFLGDVFPANTPYMIVTQGSSYSDKLAMESLAMIFAAFTPETKAKLVRDRLLAPTAQMIWRRGQEDMGGDEAYLSGDAHPTVFDPARAEPLRMIDMAAALRPDEIPPMVRLSVLQESQPAPGVMIFGDGLVERLFDTPSAIARIMRGSARTKRMTVGAGSTRDPNGRPLTYRWVLLRGDPEKVRISPLGANGEGADIEVDWTEETRTPDGLRSHRVDIGVFAHNGANWSAPAIISVAFPPREKRSYDAQGRLEMMDFDSAARQRNYSDPWLFPLRGWRDVHTLDTEGRPLGWTRSADEGFGRYTRHGALIEKEDALGRAVSARIMSYPMTPGPEGRRRIAPIETPRRLIYEYDDDEDRQGVTRMEAVE